MKVCPLCAATRRDRCTCLDGAADSLREHSVNRALEAKVIRQQQEVAAGGAEQQQPILKKIKVEQQDVAVAGTVEMAVQTNVQGAEFLKSKSLKDHYYGRKKAWHAERAQLQNELAEEREKNAALQADDRAWALKLFEERGKLAELRSVCAAREAAEEARRSNARAGRASSSGDRATKKC